MELPKAPKWASKTRLKRHCVLSPACGLSFRVSKHSLNSHLFPTIFVNSLHAALGPLFSILLIKMMFQIVVSGEINNWIIACKAGGAFMKFWIDSVREKLFLRIFERIINQFPFDGSKTELIEFIDSLSGFEKYVFDKFPKFKGDLRFQKGSSQHLSAQDKSGYLFPEISRKCEASIKRSVYLCLLMRGMRKTKSGIKRIRA